MDTKHSHLVQMGEVGQAITFYFEDYAHTYLKKQEGKDRLYLYGELEEEEQKKLYIYGVAEEPKLEQEYFKEYRPLGYLIKSENSLLWYYEKKEKEIKGYYIFYATNKSMQEYLIHQGSEKKEKETEVKEKRKREDIGEIPIKEVLLSKSYGRGNTVNKGSLPWLPAALILLLLVGTVMFSENGKKKIEVFKEIAKEVVLENSKEEADIIIEEKSINVTDDLTEGSKMNLTVSEDSVPAKEEKGEESQGEIINNQEAGVVEEVTEEITAAEVIAQSTATQIEKEVQQAAEEKQPEEIIETKEKAMEEYVVKEGDTLAGICQRYYGTTDKMKEICSINNIQNQDYIAPGQKLYLPK
ncbi:MAG: LysM peptidoglycan-binding domain-containing protein [Lachnospiraceae bacterium]|nr:LysM peptidoglycan-binding domain-containing protein [Lachnospiraceae bacterium]